MVYLEVVSHSQLDSPSPFVLLGHLYVIGLSSLGPNYRHVILHCTSIIHQHDQLFARGWLLSPHYAWNCNIAPFKCMAQRAACPPVDLARPWMAIGLYGWQVILHLPCNEIYIKQEIHQLITADYCDYWGF